MTPVRVAPAAVEEAGRERPRVFAAHDALKEHAGAEELNQLAQKRGLPNPRDAVPVVAFQHTSIDEREAGHGFRLFDRPPEAPRSPEVVHDEVRTTDADFVQQRPKKARIPVHRVVEACRTIGAPEAREVDGEGAAERGHGGQELCPVVHGAWIAVDEDDGFGGALRLAIVNGAAHALNREVLGQQVCLSANRRRGRERAPLSPRRGCLVAAPCGKGESFRTPGARTWPMTQEPRDGNRPRLVTVTEECAGQRVDNFLLSELKGAPKSLIYRMLRTGEVRVNKGRAKPARRLCTGDVVRVPPVRLAPEAPLRVGTALQEQLRSAVIYQDEDLLVLDKPAGLSVHAGSGVRFGVIEAMRAAFPELPGLELAHRLDRDTSGTLLLAKHRLALTHLHAALRDGAVDKAYLALVRGSFPDRLREVAAPLDRSGNRAGERLVEVREGGKPALTLFRVLRRFREATLVEARPVTGRTHQIRVHARSVGHPLAGDEKYGDPAFDRELKVLGLSRLFLHASRVELMRRDHSSLAVEAPLPAALVDLLRRLD